MKKLIKSPKGQKKLAFLIASALILALLVLSPTVASVTSLQFPSYLDIGDALAQLYTKTLELASLGVTLTFYENFEFLKEIGQHINALNMLGEYG